ncbi:hypothetical protein BGW41_000140, partial [Actinomortierella wolfii]
KHEVVRYGHSSILAARCRFFDVAFQGPWKETSDGIFRKPNIEPEIFDHILRYIYTGEVTLTMDIVPGLIEAGVELLLDHLVSVCADFAAENMDENTVFWLMDISFRHNLTNSWSTATSYFDEYARDLLERDDWLTQEPDALIKALSRNTVNIDELSVWRAIVRYAYHKAGLDHKSCPLLQTPLWPGRLLVEVVDSDIDQQQQRPKNKSSIHDADGSSNPGEPNYNVIYVHDISPSIEAEITETPAEVTKPVDIIVTLPRKQHLLLQDTVRLFLPAIRFTGLGVIDFTLCLESTGLIPEELCYQFYKYHALPKDYPNDLVPPRSYSSTLLPQKQWKDLLIHVEKAMVAMNPSSTSPM